MNILYIVEQVISELAKTEPEMERLDPKMCFPYLQRYPDFQKIKHLIRQISGASFFMGKVKGIE